MENSTFLYNKLGDTGKHKRLTRWLLTQGENSSQPLNNDVADCEVRHSSHFSSFEFWQTLNFVCANERQHSHIFYVTLLYDDVKHQCQLSILLLRRVNCTTVSFVLSVLAYMSRVVPLINSTFSFALSVKYFLHFAGGSTN